MQKEKLSSFMDGELVKDDAFITSLSSDKEMQDCWHRYHIARDALHSTLHAQTITIDICEKVSLAIANESIETVYQDQPLASDVATPESKALFWPKFKDMFSRVGQVGLAACVTLSVIAGVQYYSDQSSASSNVPSFNTTPIGVNVSPVGGINTTIDSPEKTVTENKITQEQYEKIYLLLQDFELQKRLNATR